MFASRSCRMTWPAVSFALSLALALVALPRQMQAAPAGHVAFELTPRTSVDWSRGLLIARGAASADLRAPSPEIARVAAERKARDQAHAHLAEAARSMNVAGRLLSAHMAERPELADALRRAVAGAADLQVEYASDGSTVILAALPLEALRLLVQGMPEAALGAKPAGPSALLIDARGVMTAPQLGVLVEIDKERYAAPAVFYATRAAAAADPRVGKEPAWARASAQTRTDEGAVPVLVVGKAEGEGDGRGSGRGKNLGKGRGSDRRAAEAVRQAAKAGALVVIVIGKSS